MTTKAPESVLIDEARLRDVMEIGGRADVTIRSQKSGQHVRVSLTAKKRNPSGRGYVSRAKNEGRVGIGEADIVFANDPAVDFGSSKLASLQRTGKWAGRVFVDTQDASRAWAARMLLNVARGESSFGDAYEVFLATRCCVCAKKLEDPQSIERGIGPECYGKSTKSKALPHPPEQLAIAPEPEEDPPVPLHVRVRQAAEEISGCEMDRETGEFHPRACGSLVAMAAAIDGEPTLDEEYRAVVA